MAFQPYRLREGLGIWEHRGKVAAVGIGHSPIDRRWDERAETSLGAYGIIAATKALEDVGVTPDQVDGVISAPGPLGERWAPRPIPADFAAKYQATSNPEDGLTMVSAEWLAKNMGLTNVKYSESAPPRISEALCWAAEAIGAGLCSVCLVLRPLGNLAGRYGQAGTMAAPEARGGSQWSMPWGWSGPAADMKQPPAYILGHYTNRFETRGAHETLEEMEFAAASAAHKLYEASGHGAEDVQVWNLYDGYALFTAFWLEGFGCFGVKHGEALDFYNSDISVEGPHPFNPSGGNNGGGRTHGNVHFTDSIQQVQGRAGGRQLKNVNISVANCTRQLGCAGLMFGKNPD